MSIANQLPVIFDAIAKEHGFRLAAMALVEGSDVITTFNPHMEECRCDNYKDLVANIKAQFCLHGDYGERTNAQTSVTQ
jgi:hypothetical protein